MFFKSLKIETLQEQRQLLMIKEIIHKEDIILNLRVPSNSFKTCKTKLYRAIEKTNKLSHGTDFSTHFYQN